MITIIDYDLGNTGSVVNALNKLRVPNRISSSPAVLKKASALILPGVGAAGQGMKNLKNRKLDKVIKEEIIRGKPFLGICLGMQLLFEKSEEGNVPCLGILAGEVKKFQKEGKVPQIGWNDIRIQNSRLRQGFGGQVELRIKNLFQNLPNNSYFYFINSYYCVPEDNGIVVGMSLYGEQFASIVVKKNIVATQFHPEKSGRAGQRFLNNDFKYFNDINH